MVLSKNCRTSATSEIGLLLQISILFIIYSIVLVVFGVKNALIIAFLCALL
ncbi:hypothetical protein N9Z01_08465, partial [Flavobacteriaceae bacterium]|nr:hypothetical protein [Flavobacteriaceae bacterium]